MVQVAAAGDDAVRRRVAFLRAGLDYTDIQARAYRIMDGAKDRALTPEEKAESGALMDRRWRMMRKMFKDEPFAVNLAYVCWGERLGPLGWHGPSPKVKAEVEADEVGRPVEAPK